MFFHKLKTKHYFLVITLVNINYTTEINYMFFVFYMYFVLYNVAVILLCRMRRQTFSLFAYCRCCNCRRSRFTTSFASFQMTHPKGKEAVEYVFDAPFFTTWYYSMWNALFLPIYLIGRQFWCNHDKAAAKVLFMWVLSEPADSNKILIYFKVSFVKHC